MIKTPRLGTLLREAAELLPSSDELASLELQVLIASVTGFSRAKLLAETNYSLSDKEFEALESLLVRRRGGEPIAYILGEKEFFSRTFLVDERVLIPRPETELLVETCLEFLSPASKLLELGTGSACIPITLVLESSFLAPLVSVDRSELALEVALLNRARFSLEKQVCFVLGDWSQSFAPDSFDFVVSNPPYVAESEQVSSDCKFEPSSALYADEAGLKDFRKILSGLKSCLSVSGKVLFEHGCSQASALKLLAESLGYRRIDCRKDLAGLERVSVFELL